MSNEKRPDRTTMEGMIWNANHVLDQALSPGKSTFLLFYDMNSCVQTLVSTTLDCLY